MQGNMTGNFVLLNITLVEFVFGLLKTGNIVLTRST